MANVPIKPRWSGLGGRLVTAIVVVLVCLAPFYLGGYAWAALVALFAARMMYEWIRMTDLEATVIAFSLAIVGLLVSLLYAAQGLLFWAFGAMIATTLFAIAERLRRGDPFWTGIGLPYVIVPAVVIILLRGSEVGFDTRGFTQLVFVILVVIGADVGAYFGGSIFRGPKLAPTLSPNKTWSGVVSGLVAACAMAAIAGLFMGLPVRLSAMLAIPLVILSVIGDLAESMVKRRIGVKDTGDILPGHGGLLDRLDSLMTAVVGGVIIFMIIGDRWPIV